MLNILVSGASGIVGYGILRSLRESGNYHLIGTSIYNESAALLFSHVFEKAPLTSDSSYFDWLLNLISKHSIDVLIPGIESDMYKWNENRQLLEKSGVKIVLNNYELIKLCKDKWLFYEYLSQFMPEICIPTFLSISEINFEGPIILKPRVGYGSKGIVKLNNKFEIRDFKNRVGADLMIQPHVGDDSNEFTISAFFDQNSNLIDFLPLKRKLSSDGYTEIAEVVNISCKDILVRLGDVLRPIGPTNFQFRMDGPKLLLLEVNPRISSATSIRAKLGFNESERIVEYLVHGILPRKIEINDKLNKKAIRFIDELIINDCNN
jgi:carbamoyl-phosphate synthase large subunit